MKGVLPAKCDEMPRTYIRKTTKGSWNTEDLVQAINVVANKEMSMRKAAKKFNIPYSTLQERINHSNYQPPRLGCMSVFSSSNEQEIADHVIKLANLFYGLTPLQLRAAAYTFAVKNNIKNKFNHHHKVAGVDWFRNFIRRNPSVTVRKPEATSMSRITAFNKTEVSLFFQNLEKVMEKYNFTPANIYNMDETGISTVQDPGKIIAPKGQKRVGSITSWERGKNVTVICGMSSSGTFIPPTFIFLRKRMSNQLTKNGPPVALYQCTKNGWTNEEVFLEWLKHFNYYAKPSQEYPVLLILDNHNSHISMAAYEFCRSKHIVMLSLPPHTSHRLQPLDVSFFGPLKAAFKRECDLYIKSHCLVKITPYDLVELFNKAYSCVATIQKGISGFASTGIVPLNPNIFTDEDYFAAATLNCDDPINVIETPNTSNSTPQSSKNADDSLVSPQISQSLVSIEELTPIPKKMPIKIVRRVAAKQHSTLITGTPMKDKLQEREKKRKEKSTKTEAKLQKIRNSKPKCTKKDKITKRNLFDDFENDLKHKSEKKKSLQKDFLINQVMMKVLI
ncbi:uncharacterized protein LOC111029276 [Myzus persicae]|uniref:uncharacterized protein LOC111029276 n=1 Tax=Myzus persicae TaxID=13164 RepID=UPI000B937E07|nr:uncharacterized protein LOC111029276 [Myzus persicae]